MKFDDAFAKLRYNLERKNHHTFTGKVVKIVADDSEDYTEIQTPLGKKKVPRNVSDRIGQRRIRLQTDTGEVDTPL